MKTDAIRECLELASSYNGEADAMANEAYKELQALLDRIEELENE